MDSSPSHLPGFGSPAPEESLPAGESPSQEAPAHLSGSAPAPEETPASEAPAQDSVREVKYSLKEILREVEGERRGSHIGREIVDQTEIQKLFRDAKRQRRDTRD